MLNQISFESAAGSNTITLNMTREALADYLNVARQSLSRELSAMQEEGLIEVSGKRSIILDQERLEEYL